MRQGQAEDLEPERRPGGRAVGVHETNPVARDLELAADQALDGRSRQRPHGALRSRLCPRGRPGVPEVHPHQRFDAAARVAAVAAQRVGDALLELVGQHVHIAAALDVEYGAHAEQELFRLAQHVRRPPALELERAGLQRPQIPGGRDVAKTPGSVLDVRLELVERVVELAMALFHELEQRIDNLILRGGADAGGRLAAAVEQRQVSGDRACVEQRHQELDVVAIEHLEFRALPDVMTDHELEIPEGLQHGVHEPLVVARNPTLEEDQQIDVRVETERATAVSAERANHDGWLETSSAAATSRSRSRPSARRTRRLGVAAAAAAARLEATAARGGEHAGQLSPDTPARRRGRARRRDRHDRVWRQ